MATEEESLQALSRAVMTEARGESEQALAEARQKAETIRLEAQKQAEAERERVLKNAQVEAARIRSQAIASAHLKARTTGLEQREKILTEVFEKARQRIPSIQQDPSYHETALALLKEAISHLGSDSARISADRGTQNLFTQEALAAISKETGVKLEIGEPLKQGTGVVIQTPDGHRQYDNTLETRLSRMQDSLRDPVNRLLMGGK